MTGSLKSSRGNPVGRRYRTLHYKSSPRRQLTDWSWWTLTDIFASSGWTPCRSTLDNIIDGLEFIVQPLLDLMWTRVLSDLGVGIDDTNVTLLMPSALPEVKEDDTPEQQLKTRRLVEKMLEAQRKGEASLNAKMWVYSGLVNQPYNLFDFRVTRHRDGPKELALSRQRPRR